MGRDIIEKQAKYLARENRMGASDIERIFWFPDDDEVRLVESTAMVPPEGFVEPFWFRAQPKDDLPAPSGVALIHPSEVGNAVLPDDWGDWNSAVELKGEE